MSGLEFCEVNQNDWRDERTLDMSVSRRNSRLDLLSVLTV